MFKFMTVSERIVLTLIIAFVLFTLSLAWVAVSTESKCLSMGYHDYKIDYKFNRYCIVLDTDANGRVYSKAIPFKYAIPRN